MPLNLTCTTEQKLLVSAHPLTHGTSTTPGMPATLDGPLVFMLQSGDGMAEMAADGLSAFLMSDVAGVSTWMVSGDADLGTGVTTIDDMVMLTVTDPLAEHLGLAAGEPEPR